MILLLWAKIQSYAAGIGVALAVIAGVFFYGRSDGKTAARQEQEKANAKAVKKARGVEDDVQKMGGDTVSRDLDKWMRDKR
jgi:hypothetical protein